MQASMCIKICAAVSSLLPGQLDRGVRRTAHLLSLMTWSHPALQGSGLGFEGWLFKDGVYEYPAVRKDNHARIGQQTQVLNLKPNGSISLCQQ